MRGRQHRRDCGKTRRNSRCRVSCVEVKDFLCEEVEENHSNTGLRRSEAQPRADVGRKRFHHVEVSGSQTTGRVEQKDKIKRISASVAHAIKATHTIVRRVARRELFESRRTHGVVRARSIRHGGCRHRLELRSSCAHGQR